jgi:trehalose 6-phosphate phosphatase
MRRRGNAGVPPAISLDTALFLDVDGTLLDIAPTPDSVVMPDGLIETLGRLNAALGGAVALISGRRRADLRQLFRGADVILIGEHGATASVPLPAIDAARGERPPPGLVAALRRFAVRHPDTLLELKAHGAALHVRGAPSAAPAARRLAHMLAESYRDRVRLLRGKAVFEFVSTSVSKGRAIEALLEQPAFRTRTCYVVGDDVTDEDGFAVANRLGGISLRVGTSDLKMAGSIARFAIASPAQLRKCLRGWADALGTERHEAPRGNHRILRAS